MWGGNSTPIHCYALPFVSLKCSTPEVRRARRPVSRFSSYDSELYRIVFILLYFSILADSFPAFYGQLVKNKLVPEWPVCKSFRTGETSMPHAQTLIFYGDLESLCVLHQQTCFWVETLVFDILQARCKCIIFQLRDTSVIFLCFNCCIPIGNLFFLWFLRMIGYMANLAHHGPELHQDFEICPGETETSGALSSAGVKVPKMLYLGHKRVVILSLTSTAGHVSNITFYSGCKQNFLFEFAFSTQKLLQDRGISFLIWMISKSTSSCPSLAVGSNFSSLTYLKGSTTPSLLLTGPFHRVCDFVRFVSSTTFLWCLNAIFRKVHVSNKSVPFRYLTHCFLKSEAISKAI